MNDGKKSSTKLSLVATGKYSDYTYVWNVVNQVFGQIQVEEKDHEHFARGQVGRIYHDGKDVGTIGVASNAWLDERGVSQSVVICELILNEPK